MCTILLQHNTNNTNAQDRATVIAGQQDIVGVTSGSYFSLATEIRRNKKTYITVISQLQWGPIAAVQ